MGIEGARRTWGAMAAGASAKSGLAAVLLAAAGQTAVGQTLSAVPVRTPPGWERHAAKHGGIEAVHVRGNVHMLVGAGANIAVQTGEEGVLVVDTGLAARRGEVLAVIRQLSDKPIRWIINTHPHADHIGGNEALSQAGMTVNGNPAAIVAHERTMLRMAAAGRSVTELPLNTFFVDRRDFYFNGEAIILYHAPAHTDGDILVYFRGSDVLVAGDVFGTTHYPRIDLDAGGGIDGFIEGLNLMLDIMVPAYLQEGGTYVIPGHGRLGDEADVVEYRDMALFIRDRIRDMIGKGMSLDEVIASHPALDYDSRYGNESADWDTRAFIGALYRDLEREAQAR